MVKVFRVAFLPVVILGAASTAQAAQLSTEARSAVPHEVQQLTVIDYRAMQNSTAATKLRDRVMPPELKQLDEALRKSGLDDDHDIEQLAFVLFRSRDSGEQLETVGIAQGQFPVQDVLASLRKQKVKPILVRDNKIYPLGKTGMVACFVDSSTMVFGESDAVRKALDARDGTESSLLTNAPMMDAMKAVDTQPLWSVLDQKGTQTMLRQVLGGAGSVTDFESVHSHLQSSWYSMDFQHGINFNLTVSTGDNFAAATLSSLLNAAVAVRKMSASDAEKQALAATSFTSNAGSLAIQFAVSDTEFISLLQSPLFQSMLS
jgi:hypothetical protein